MVQLREHAPRASKNDYWKLDSGNRLLTKKQLLCALKPNKNSRKSQKVARLRELYVRQQCGLLSYEGVTARELRVFLKQRELPLQANVKPTLATLKTQLEQADSDVNFPRSLDPPPEVRQQILKQDFDSFDENWDRTSPVGPQPPITLASRQIRLEALPLFYSRCHFPFYVGFFHGVRSIHCELFTSNTLACNFGRIRFLKVSQLTST